MGMIRIATLEHHSRSKAIRRILQKSIKNWKNNLPWSIVCVLDSIQEEILIITETLVWLTLQRDGKKMIQGTYREYLSKWHSLLHFMFSILVPYIMKHLLSLSNSNITWFHKMAIIFRLANLTQHMYFYHLGGYQNLTDAIMRFKVSSKEILSSLNYATLNQKLIWCTFRNLVILLVSLKNYLWISEYKTEDEYPDPWTIVCGRCRKRVVVPVENTTCGHICCYTCMQDELTCKICGCITKSRCFRFLQMSHRNLYNVDAKRPSPVTLPIRMIGPPKS